MAVLKEFACKAHGPFEDYVSEGEIPGCPKGCSPRFVIREIRQPPKARGVVMGRLDEMQKDLAQTYGLTNLKADKEGGTSMMEELRKGEKPEDFGAFWGKNVDTSQFKPTQAMQTAQSKGEIPKLRPGQLDGRYRGPLPEA